MRPPTRSSESVPIPAHFLPFPKTSSFPFQAPHLQAVRGREEALLDIVPRAMPSRLAWLLAAVATGPGGGGAHARRLGELDALELHKVSDEGAQVHTSP